jgi:signal transduction histidine kinase
LKELFIAKITIRLIYLILSWVKKEELKLIDGTVQFNRDKTEQQGLGLGLYITKHIIKNLMVL